LLLLAMGKGVSDALKVGRSRDGWFLLV